MLVLVLVLMVVRMGMVMTMAMTMTVVMVAVPVIGHMATVGAAFGLKGQVGFDHGHGHLQKMDRDLYTGSLMA